jgi:hypothetical protein
VSAGCAEGFRCVRRSTDDAYAYCTQDCTDDRDCPTKMVCRDGEDGRYCRPRAYCEPCVLDDQCGYANDDCVADDAGGLFCSQACDPANPETTCPQDSSCIEVETGRFQCRPLYGSCVGDGTLCAPCRDGADCAEDAECVTDRYTKFSFCGSPCEEMEDCPVDEFYCSTDIGQCRPRKGSCAHPSGGKHTCESCGDFTDCFNGWCMDSNADGMPDSCADRCDPEDADACGPWATCFEITDGSTTIGYACFPHEGMACWQWRNCMEDCPDGPSGCRLSYCD